MGANHKTTRASHKALAAFRTACADADLPCWICGQRIDYAAASTDYSNDDRFQRDHRHPVSTHPQLQEDPANWEASHAGCNRARSNGVPRPPLGRTSRAWTG